MERGSSIGFHDISGSLKSPERLSGLDSKVSKTEGKGLFGIFSEGEATGGLDQDQHQTSSSKAGVFELVQLGAGWRIVCEGWGPPRDRSE